MPVDPPTRIASNVAVAVIETPAPPAAVPDLAVEAGVRRRALRGSAATLVGYAVLSVIRLGSNLVLTRLLVPEYFGVMALVNVFMQGLHMFSDIGIGPSIIQHPRGDEPKFLHTAWTMQVLRGLALTVAAGSLAYPMAAFYGFPELAWMIPIASTTALLDGFGSTHLFTENRHLRLGRVTVVEVLSQAASALVMIAVAWSTRSIVALLVGGIASASTRAFLSHFFLPGARDRFAWDPEARVALLRFGRWIFLSTALTFLGLQLDRLVLGRLVSPRLLGVYSIAAMLAALPREVYGQLSQKVLYPLVAGIVRENGDPERLRTFRIRTLAIAAVPMGVIVGASESAIDLLYDERYLLAGRLMAALCLGTWMNVLASTYGIVVLSHGQPKWISYGTGFKSALFGVLAIPVHHAAGILGVALLVSLAELGVAAAAVVGARAFHVVTPAVDLLATLTVLAVAFGAHLFAAFVTPLVGTPFVALAALGLVGAAIPAALARSMRLV